MGGLGLGVLGLGVRIWAQVFLVRVLPLRDRGWFYWAGDYLWGWGFEGGFGTLSKIVA